MTDRKRTEPEETAAELALEFAPNAEAAGKMTVAICRALDTATAEARAPLEAEVGRLKAELSTARAAHDVTTRELNEWKQYRSESPPNTRLLAALRSIADERLGCPGCDGPMLPTCLGAYEGREPGFACDQCCGHGNEDGWCIALPLHDPRPENRHG